MPKIDQSELKTRVGEILNRWPAVGLAVGVIHDGRLGFFHAHGLADIATNTPIGEDTVFRIASITKTFTAIAVMQLWEQGLVDLDAPANGYLRAYRLIPAKAGFRPATVRHLLTHTAGIPQMVRLSRVLLSGWFGESYKLGQPRPTLGEYYRGGLRLAVEPGTTFTYSDHGPATLGQIVEDVSGKPLDCYLREHIFEPLGMAGTDFLRSEMVVSHLATGYRVRSNGPQAVTDREWMTAAASSIYSSPRDMARYLAALLGGGANEHGAILKRETLATMFEPHYQPDPRIPGMGLGFFQVDCGGHLAVEHQGVLPGFNSQIIAAPNDGVGVMAFTNGARQAANWLLPEVTGLLGDLIGSPVDGVRTDVPHQPDTWTDLCGWYRPCAQPTDMQARVMFGAGAEVFVRRGQLMVRALSPLPALYRGLPLHPDDDNDPYVFRLDLSQFGIGTGRIVFSRDAGGAATRIHLEGLLQSLEKRPANRNPRRWVTRAVGVAATALVLRRRRTARRQA